MSPDLASAHWRKSSHSGGTGGNCVEVAVTAIGTAVRDSKNPTGPALAFQPAQWSAFLNDVQANLFDRAV